MINLELAKSDPAQVFKHPDEVVHLQGVSLADKIDILQRWAYDEREKVVAEEENMPDLLHDEENLLEDISRCLLELQNANNH